MLPVISGFMKNPRRRLQNTYFGKVALDLMMCKKFPCCEIIIQHKEGILPFVKNISGLIVPFFSILL
jgi:hypothetical protein